MTKVRKELKTLVEYRGVFSGSFKRFGEKRGYNGYPETTVLLLEVRDSEGLIVSDHLWFNYTKGFEKLGKLNLGDIIQFNARVKKYQKGYQGYREDVPRNKTWNYKLSHPTKLSIIRSNQDLLSNIKKEQELEIHQGKYEELNRKIHKYLKNRFLIKRKSNVSSQLIYNIYKKEICSTVVDYNKNLNSLSSAELALLIQEIKDWITSIATGFEIKTLKSDLRYDKKRRKKLLFRLTLH